VADISAISSSTYTSSIDQLVQQTLAKERKPVDDLQAQKNDLSHRLTVYTDLKTKLNALVEAAKGFTRLNALNSLIKKTAASSNENYATITATGSAENGKYDLKVERLAAQDTTLSKQFTAAGTDLAASSSGTQYFTLAVGSGTPVTISVNIDPGDTNETVLNKLRDAINNAKLDVTATIVHDTGSTVRLVVKSAKTGSENALMFDEIDGSNILQKLRYLTNTGDRRLSTDGSGGFLVQNTDDLDAKIVLDGIEIIKGTNEITDAITGATIKLQRAQSSDDQPITLTIANDAKGTRTEIEKFIEQYNNVIKYLIEKTRIDTVNFTRGDLAGDVVFSGLKFSLRSVVTGKVEGLPENVPAFLTSIGISIARDGTLSITNSEKFDDKLTNNTEQVTNLFVGDNGLGSKMVSLLNRFVSTGGTVDRTEKGVNRQISSIDTRIKNYEERLSIRAEALHKQYAQLQNTLNSLSYQQSTLTELLNNTLSSS
jgi:flagellar hook-associated protein 2